MTRRVISAALVWASLGLAGSVLSAGCSSTAFKGEAQPEGGRCESRCESWGMRLASRVTLGQLTSGCVCENAGNRSILGAIGTADGAVSAR